MEIKEDITRSQEVKSVLSKYFSNNLPSNEYLAIAILSGKVTSMPISYTNDVELSELFDNTGSTQIIIDSKGRVSNQKGYIFRCLSDMCLKSAGFSTQTESIEKELAEAQEGFNKEVRFRSKNIARIHELETEIKNTNNLLEDMRKKVVDSNSEAAEAKFEAERVRKLYNELRKKGV